MASRHRERAGFENAFDPVHVWQTGSLESLEFAIDVVFHTPNGGREILEEKVRGARIAVIGKADASGVDNGQSSKFSNVRAVDVSVDGNWLTEGTEDGF